MRRLEILVTAVFLFTLVPGLLAQASLASAKPPAYPLTAQAAGIEGAVILKCLITKEGKVQNIHVISGPPELQQAAVDAVSHWTYHPYRHFGHPVEVDTTVTVNFSLGHGEAKHAAQAKAKAELLASQSAIPQDPITATPPPY